MRAALVARLLVLVLAFLSQAGAQAAPSQKHASAEHPELTVSSRTTLVLVPALVTNHSGQHVTGLAKGVFSIEQDGKAQAVTVFEEVRQTAPVSRPVAETPGVVANYAPADSNSRRVVIVVVDLLNTPFLSQGRAKAALISFLENSLPPDEQVGLFSLGANGLHQLHSFTADTYPLIAALRKASGQLGTDDKIATGDESQQVSATPGADDEAASIIQQLQADSEALYGAYKQRETIRTTLTAFEQVANAFSGIPGRKALIWATGGFPFTIDDPQAFARMGTDMIEFYERTWRALNDATIAVYPVDVNGLAGPDLNRGISGMVPRNPRAIGRGAIAAPRPIPYDRHREQLDAMRAFADATGGKAFFNRNDIESGFRTAEQDSLSYYMLGFYLKDDQRSGWHKLRVKVNAPGLEIRAREGFYAAAAPQTTEEARKQEMLTAIVSPVDYTALHFGVRLTAVSKRTIEPLNPGAASATTTTAAKTRASIGYSLLIPKESLFIDAARENTIDLDLAVFGFGSDGRLTGQSLQHVTAKLSGGPAQRGISLQQAIDVAPGTSELRFCVRDNQSDKLGTVRTPAELK